MLENQITMEKLDTITNFWELWASYSKRNKMQLKKLFLWQVPNMNINTLNSLFHRQNFTLEEQKIWFKIIGIPLNFDKKIKQ